MNNILADYCQIFLTTQPWQRKQRHLLLQNWLKQQVVVLPSFSEIMDFVLMVKKQQQIQLTHPFYQKLFFPIIDPQIQNKNLLAIKYLLNEGLESYYSNYKQDYSINLLQLALSLQPDDQNLLLMRANQLVDYFAYTIHEVPWGVLSDINGATIEATSTLLNELDAFERLSQQLNLDNHALISQCRFYFQAWINYLSHQSQYDNFEAYLSINPYKH